MKYLLCIDYVYLHNMYEGLCIDNAYHQEGITLYIFLYEGLCINYFIYFYECLCKNYVYVKYFKFTPLYSKINKTWRIIKVREFYVNRFTLEFVQSPESSTHASPCSATLAVYGVLTVQYTARQHVQLGCVWVYSWAFKSFTTNQPQLNATFNLFIHWEL